ncbi:hypothetical protein GOODEAATRI_031313 [Goodea atripinnis]|uniref:Uncharacterized protein n=1 Tax=Goodea atripinnis TaxID=208336 RepID=A0ABV0NFA3_9TELE
MGVFQVDWQGSDPPAFNSPSMVSAIPASAAGECGYWFRQMGKTSCYLNSTENTPAILGVDAKVEELLLGVPHSAVGSCGPNYPFAHRLGRRRNQPLPVQPFLRPYCQRVHPWPGHEDHMSMTPTEWVEPVDIHW